MKTKTKGIGGRKALDESELKSKRFSIFFTERELQAIQRKADGEEPVKYWRRAMLEQSGVASA